MIVCSSLFFHCNIALCFYETLVCVLLYNLGLDPILKTWGFVETSDIHTSTGVRGVIKLGNHCFIV